MSGRCQNFLPYRADAVGGFAARRIRTLIPEPESSYLNNVEILGFSPLHCAHIRPGQPDIFPFLSFINGAQQSPFHNAFAPHFVSDFTF